MWALIWKGICPTLHDSLSDSSSSASVSLHNLSWLLAAVASVCENQYNTTVIWKCTTPNLFLEQISLAKLLLLLLPSEVITVQNFVLNAVSILLGLKNFSVKNLCM